MGRRNVVFHWKKKIEKPINWKNKGNSKMKEASGDVQLLEDRRLRGIIAVF